MSNDDGGDLDVCNTRIFHVMDIDYEARLYTNTAASSSAYTPSQNTRRRVIDYEYIYFLLYNQGDDHGPGREDVKRSQQYGLLCRRSYDESYFEHLSRLGFKIPPVLIHESTFSSPPVSEKSKIEVKIKTFWGHNHGEEIERLLNSKITSAKIAKENGWGFHRDHSTLVRTYEDVVKHVQKYWKGNSCDPQFDRWLLRRPQYSSGIGQKMFLASTFTRDTVANYLSCKDHSDDDNEIDQVLLEPYYTRVVDIGTTFIIDPKGNILRQFMVENFIAESGGFSGGVGAATYDVFKLYIERKYEFYELDNLVEITKDIANIYISMGARGNVQIDSFVYKEYDSVRGDFKMNIYPLVEVNYRKTMGLVIQRLADMYTSEATSDYIEWKLISKKQLDKASKSNANFTWDEFQYTLTWDDDVGDGDNVDDIDHIGNHWKQLSPPDNLVHSFFRIRTLPPGR